jgi:hypothetical protein
MASDALMEDLLEKNGEFPEDLLVHVAGEPVPHVPG